MAKKPGPHPRMSKDTTSYMIPIAERRVALGITRPALGKRLGYHRQSLYSWEHGINTPSVVAWLNMCEELGLEIRVNAKGASDQDILVNAPLLSYHDHE